jgi:hypothetical protein
MWRICSTCWAAAGSREVSARISLSQVGAVGTGSMQHENQCVVLNIVMAEGNTVRRTQARASFQQEVEGRGAGF